jgi:co-chaperonin GroES (HSP10)
MVGFGRVAAAVVGVSCLILSAAFVSCGKNTSGGGDVKRQESVTNDSGKAPESVTDDGGKGTGGGVKLLESITDDNGKALKKFEYDGQNRLVKIYSGDDITTIAYAGNSVTVNDMKYVINGNTVKVESGYPMTTFIDKDGYIVSRESEEWTSNMLYNYQDGNLTGVTMDECSPSYEPYDDKKSPFSNSKTPKWLIQELFDIGDASKNNAIKYSSCEGVDAYLTFVNEYEYDGEGFPVRRKQTMNGETDTGTVRFTYFVKGKTE